MNPLIEQYLSEVKATKAGKTLLDYTARMKRFDRYLTENCITELSRDVCVNFIIALKGTLGEASRYYHEQTVKFFLNWCAKAGKIERNWLQGESFSSYRSIKRPESFAFTQKEYRALLRHCPDEQWRGFIMFGWHTALRMGDIANLQWSNISFPEGKVSIVPRKTKRFGKALEIPIAGDVYDWLLPKYTDHESTYIFPRLQRIYSQRHNLVCAEFKVICQNAGVKDKTFHGLRHSWVTRALSSGVGIGIVSEITGQSIPVIQRYLHPTMEDKVKALSVMQ